MKTSGEPKSSPESLWSVEFRKEREADWTDLEQMVEVALKKGMRALPATDVRRLPVLYRSTLSSLSVARRTAMDRRLIGYLEALAARAYLVVYGSRRPTRGAITHFLARRFPREIRRLWPEIALSTLVFFLGVAVAFVLTGSDDSWFYAFVPAEMASGRTPASSTEFLREVLYSEGGGLLDFASFLFTHNARVGMVAFALGFAAGIPTFLLIFYNGLVLGAFAALYAERGLLLPLLGWLLPHGIPEIAAVILCGAAGFHLGRALLWPGRSLVRDAMIAAGRRAACVVMGTIVLFALAGIIEGIFRQAVADDLTRYILAAFNASWLFVWLVIAGRGGADENEAVSPEHAPGAAVQGEMSG